MLFIGIDGGGTRARALLVDGDGREIARANGPAGIIDAADPVRGAQAAIELVRSLAAEARVTLPVRRLCCGLAGAGRGTERAAVRVTLLMAGVAEDVIVTGDADAAMADAFDAEPGVLLIAGTGSIAWARAADGRTLQVGGWGRLIGDEGSGFAVGVEAVRAVLRAWDGRSPDTSLTMAVLSVTGCHGPPDLVRFAATAAKADFAALAPLVIEHATAGDPAAVRIRDDALDALTELVVTAARRAQLAGPVIATAGGLAAPGSPLHAQLRERLLAALPAAQLLTTTVDAARGAARLAMNAGT
jgi:N-acetylglucosamine kinase-like BadF-type ATPase